MIKWFKRWFMGEPEIVKSGNLYLVRVKCGFISHYVGRVTLYKWASFNCALKYASFRDIESARKHLNSYKMREEVIE